MHGAWASVGLWAMKVWFMCLCLRFPGLLRLGLEGWNAPSPSPSNGGRGNDLFVRTGVVFCVGLPLPKHCRIGADALVLV